MNIFNTYLGSEGMKGEDLSLLLRSSKGPHSPKAGTRSINTHARRAPTKTTSSFDRSLSARLALCQSWAKRRNWAQHLKKIK